MSASWDIKLAGKPYMFPDKTSGLTLGAALTEPGNPSQVDGIVIASLHGGIGRGYDNGILQYDSLSEADATMPNTLLPGYPTVSVGSFTASSLSAMRPAFGYGNGAKYVFVMAGQTMKYFDPTNPAGGLTAVTIGGATFPTNSELSGSMFQYNNELIFGVIKNDAGNEGHPGAWGYIADSLGTPGTATLSTSTKISYGASTRARAFWIEDNGNYGLRWAPAVDGANFMNAPSGTTFVEKPDSGTPPIAIGYPLVSWMTMVGSALVILRQDGAIIGADETGMLVVLGQTPLSGLEVNFGHRATAFHDGLLVPSRNGLWSFDLRSLTMRPASPNYIQGQPNERLRGEVMAANGIGSYGFVASRQVASNGTTITSNGLEIVHYSDRVTIHDLIPTTSANEVIVDFLPFYDTVNRRTMLYYLVHNESTDSVEVRYKPLRLPSDQHTAATGITTGGSVSLAPLGGPSPASDMTKLFTQVRGHFVKGTGGSATLVFTGFTVDGAAVTLATVTADGPFAVPFGGTIANRIGRELTAGTITLTNPVLDTRLDLPLTFDFVWVPSSEDALTIKVLISGEVQGGISSLWRRSPWVDTKDLLALRNTTTTLVFPEGDSWTVFVEGVSIPEIETPGGVGQNERVATIQLRRLV